MLSLIGFDPTHLVATYGYAAVALIVALESTGMPLPGETVLIAAALDAGERIAGQVGITLAVLAAARAVAGALFPPPQDPARGQGRARLPRPARAACRAAGGMLMSQPVRKGVRCLCNLGLCNLGLCNLAMAAGASMALAGCARFRPEPLSPAVNAAALEGRTLDNPRLQRFLLAALPAGRAAPDAAWTLGTLTLAALYYHPDLAVADARLAVSQAGVITARERPNPTLNFSAVFGTAAVSGAALPPGVLPMIVGPVINVLIETFGKREDRTAQAQHLVEAARKDVDTAAWQVRGRVRTALLNLWAAQRRLGLARQEIATRQQLLALLEQRLVAGFATALDVTRERIALAQASLGIRDVNRLEADARVQLAVAIGVPARALDGVRISTAAFDHPAAPAADGATGPLRRRALAERTDVRSSLAQYEAAQSALQLQVANQYPNLLLGPGYTYEFGINRFILSPALDFPIFNQNQGPIAQAAANRQQAAASFTALQAQVIGAIDAAAATYRTTAQSLDAADALLVGEQVRQRQARATFAAGESDRPTLVAAELEAAVIRSSRFDALALHRQALGVLEDALQHPLFDSQAALFVPCANPRTAPEASP